MSNPETRIVLKIREAIRIKFPGSFFFKVHGSDFMETGLPDLIGCVHGKFFGIEVKQPGHKPTAIQLHQIGRIKRAGGIAGYATTPIEALKIISDGLFKQNSPDSSDVPY